MVLLVFMKCDLDPPPPSAPFTTLYAMGSTYNTDISYFGRWRVTPATSLPRARLCGTCDY